MSAMQLVLLLVGLAGGLWWAGSGVLSARPYVGGMPLPFWLLLGGLGLSLGLVALCRLLVGRAAARRAAAVEKALGRTVQTATDELVIAPLAAELDAYRVVTDALRAAQA